MKKNKSLWRVLAWLLVAAMVGTGMPSSITVSAKSKPKLSRTKATIRVGKTVRLRVRHAPRKTKVRWSSSSKKVAVVSSKGLVRGKKAGKAVIKAKVGKKTLRCRITVLKKKSTGGKETDSQTSPSPQSVATAVPTPGRSLAPSPTATPSPTPGAGATDSGKSTGSGGTTTGTGNGETGGTGTTETGNGEQSGSGTTGTGNGEQSGSGTTETGNGEQSGTGTTETGNGETGGTGTTETGNGEQSGTGTTETGNGETGGTGTTETGNGEQAGTGTTETGNGEQAGTGTTETGNGEQSGTTTGTGEGEKATTTPSGTGEGEKATSTPSAAGGDSQGESAVETTEPPIVTVDPARWQVTSTPTPVVQLETPIAGVTEQPGTIEISKVTLPPEESEEPEVEETPVPTYEVTLTTKVNGVTANVPDTTYALRKSDSVALLAGTGDSGEITFEEKVEPGTYEVWSYNADGSCKVADWKIDEDDSSHSKTLDYYTVTFHYNKDNGEADDIIEGVDAQYILSGGTAAEPNTALIGYAEHRFLMWTTEAKTSLETGGTADNSLAFSFATEITQKTDLYAYWKKDASITTCQVICYDTTHKEAIETYTVSGTSGETFTAPEIDGYTAASDNETYHFGSSTQTVTFNYTPKQYTITWNVGTVTVGEVPALTANTTEYYYGDAVTAPTLTAPKGYEFAGWVDLISETKDTLKEGQEVSSLFQDDEDEITYTAQWTPIVYAITYDLAGGKGDMVGEYTIEDTVTLVSPTKAGGSFIGWIANGDTTGDTTVQEEVSFSQETGAKSYTAKWDSIYYVYHWLQGSDQTKDDTYSLEDTEELTAEEGATVSPVAKTAGTYQYYTTPDTSKISGTVTAAADGILTFNLYYNCRTTGLCWNLNGGKTASGDGTITIEEVRYGYSMKAYTTGDGGQFLAIEGYELEYWEGSDGTKLTPGQTFTMPYIENGTLTYTAHWKAKTDTPYNVVYHKATLGSGGLEFEDQVVTAYGTGTTGAEVSMTAPAMTGFYVRSDSQGTKTITINGDGSSYFEFYYLRNTYPVTWKLNGGNISNVTDDVSTSVEYGAVITAPANVKRTGYDLTGWVDEQNNTLTGNNVMGTTAQKYTAQWKGAGGIAYTIRYWQQNVDNDNYTEVTSDRVTATGTTGDKISLAVYRKTYTGFTETETSAAAQTLTIAGDGSAVQDFYYDRNVHTMTFNLNGGNIDGNTANIVKTFRYGALIVPPENVVRAGYTYSNWTSSNSSSTLDKVNTTRTAGDEDVTYTVNWKAGASDGYTVVHKLQNAEGDYETVEGDNETVTKGVTVGQECTVYAKTEKSSNADYTIYTPKETSQTFTAEAAATTVTFLYDRNTYTLTFDLGDSGSFTSKSYSKEMSIQWGASVTLPAASDVSRSGYKLTGWTYNGESKKAGDTITMPASKATVTAVWTQDTSEQAKTADRFVVRSSTDQKAPSYTFYLGETLEEVEEELLPAEEFFYTTDEDADLSEVDLSECEWNKDIVRTDDKIPQGYTAYVFKADGASDYLEEGNYFQLYVDNGIVVGMATINPYFSYEDADGTAYIHGKTALSGSNWNSMSSYNYSDAKYAEINDAYVVAYVDAFDGNESHYVYGTQIFSKTNGSGKAVTLKDLLLTQQINANGGYAGYSNDEQNDMALELQEWGRAYRHYALIDKTTQYSTTNFAVVPENEDSLPALAQIHAKYEAANKTVQTATFAAEITELKNLGITLTDTGLGKRFDAGYAAALNREDEGCLVSKELVGSGSPDAMGFLTWWLDSKNSDGAAARTKLVFTASSTNDVDASSIRVVGGFAYTSSADQYTYAALDLFAMD